jgi:hypothetical protein
MNYDWRNPKRYCGLLGLKWLGDEYVEQFDNVAEDVGLSQRQLEKVVWHALSHVRYLFSPQNYRYRQRIAMAMWFLFGRWK